MKTITALGLATLLGLAASLSIGWAGTIAATAADNHASWCNQNYRSYNSRTDSFTGFDGLAHRCISPFDTDGLAVATVRPFAVIPDNSVRGGVKNPNGPGSGTSMRLYPNDNEGGNNGTSGY